METPLHEMERDVMVWAGNRNQIMTPMLAYIDPGSGLLIWQAVAAVVIGLLFYLKKMRDYVVFLFRRIFRRNKPQ